MSKAYEELEIITELLQEWAEKYEYDYVNGYSFGGHATFWTRDQKGKEELEIQVWSKGR